ncbi:hypothetical protein P0L94_00915 [Microbacter sp. GSS18]|nr:hypothetical protein P0L94_00915 [Microbacter sp. GSS18]
MKAFFRGTAIALVVLVTASLGALVLLLATGAVKPFFDMSPVSVEESSRSSQVMDAVSSEKQVVLVSLGIQGIEEKSANSAFFGMAVPGSERTSFMRYEFKAKLGFEGGDVDIVETAENEYTVSIPKFIFIGHEFVSDDGEPFKLVVESAGALSWVTPEIDEADMINRILSDDARDEYIETNRELLQEQAKAFYEGIVSGIAPDATLTFEFS